MSNFRNAKVGDKVWHRLMQKWGTIVEINPEFHYPITVKFDNGETLDFTWDGCDLYVHKIPVLLWNEVEEPEPPPPPRRKVKKRICGFLNLFEYRGNVWAESGIYDSKDDAFRARSSGWKYLGDPVYIEHEWEVEE